MMTHQNGARIEITAPQESRGTTTMDGLLIFGGIVAGLMLFGMLASRFGVDTRDWYADTRGPAPATGLSA